MKRKREHGNLVLYAETDKDEGFLLEVIEFLTGKGMTWSEKK